MRHLAARSSLLLSAAREWLAAGRPADASRVLRTVGAPLAPPELYQHSLLTAEASYQLHHAQLAWREINALPPATDTAAALEYYALKIRIALAAGRAVDGINAELLGERYAASDAQRGQQRSALLAALLEARARGVDLSVRASNDPLVRGWLELGATATESRSLSLNSTTLAARWRARYPNHPALSVSRTGLPGTLGGDLARRSRGTAAWPLSGPAASAYGPDGA